MSGYLKFNTTESSYVNDILDAIKSSGDAYHHTESWYDDDVLEESCVASIERAANIAAKFIADLELQLVEKQAEIEAMRPMVEACKERYESHHKVTVLNGDPSCPCPPCQWYRDYLVRKHQ